MPFGKVPAQMAVTEVKYEVDWVGSVADLPLHTVIESKFSAHAWLYYSSWGADVQEGTIFDSVTITVEAAHAPHHTPDEVRDELRQMFSDDFPGALATWTAAAKGFTKEVVIETAAQAATEVKQTAQNVQEVAKEVSKNLPAIAFIAGALALVYVVSVFK